MPLSVRKDGVVHRHGSPFQRSSGYFSHVQNSAIAVSLLLMLPLMQVKMDEEVFRFVKNFLPSPQFFTILDAVIPTCSAILAFLQKTGSQRTLRVEDAGIHRYTSARTLRGSWLRHEVARRWPAAAPTI